MATVEDSIPAGRGGPPFAAQQVFHRLAGAAAVLALIGWTVHWVRQALPMVQAQTRIGSGAWGPRIEGHEVFEVVFVASHCLVRWAPGAALLVGCLLVLRWRAKARR